MIQVEKKTLSSFRSYYDSLEESEKTGVRNKFLSESGVSYTTFYHKLRNQSFALLEQKALENICESEFCWKCKTTSK